ncbi:MAG: protein-S-isoprenylcysteine O-methyltransferase [Cyclobacteriaceae bacterium]|jgi:protein-S-isoprenylcysteine O-methyltransferase Ste14
MFNTTFKIVYFVLFMVISTVRKYFTSKQAKKGMAKEKRTGLDIFFLVINGIGMVIPLVYVFTSKLDFANYYMPDWVGWIGVLIILDAAWLLFLSHRDLGRHWTISVGLREGHSLITTGIYKYLRHPMYAAHLVWAIGQILILHNWIAGYSFIVTMLPFYFYRSRKEEEMLIEEFGDDYRDYKQKTGALFPKF